MGDLILLRHGQTAANARGQVQGRSDIPLNETGLSQAESAAHGIAPMRPSRILSSPLSRARQTADSLARACGLQVEVDERLIERSYGDWEGLTRAEMEKGWSGEFARWRAGHDPVGVDATAPFESRREVGERVAQVLRELAPQAGFVPSDAAEAAYRGGEDHTEQQGPGPIAVVAHGAALSLGVTVLLGLNPNDWFGLRGLSNAHWGVLRSGSRPPGFSLVTWNAGGVTERT